MVDEPRFDETFRALTGNAPFPWQRALYREMAAGNPPRSCEIPTGLGKTSVMAIWLIALSEWPDVVPRRLVYVVNRRTVVDQSTAEAETYRKRLLDPEGEAGCPEDVASLHQLASALRRWTSCPEDSSYTPLAISTLRGQFADNREWSADPSRPAIIAGTVDMIGSRLLFEGYGIGFKLRPMHAGFLGQDVLLIHDEAHLEPAFQRLLEAIRAEQERSGEFRKFHVMAMSATTTGNGEDDKPFRLTSEEEAGDVEAVRVRIEATKQISLHPLKKDIADDIREIAKEHDDARRTVLIYVQKVEDVEKIVKKLPEGRKQQLTGTLRGLERDRLALEDPLFRLFLPEAQPPEQTVYLVCTSAGEVGVNISADHLVCDLTTYESMAQRFGRVNRFGLRDDTRIDVVYPKELDEKPDEAEEPRKKTLDLLRRLDGNASPSALMNLPPEDRRAAFRPEPIWLPVSDILLDAWTLTTIRGPFPGRPPVEPYLHGVEDEKAAETRVAWRDEVEVLARISEQPENRDALESYAEELLEDYPLKPHELLRDRSYRVFDRIASLAKTNPDSPAWLLNADGTVLVLSLKEMADKNQKDRIQHRTVILPPDVGGLQDGLMTGDPAHKAKDVADCWLDAEKNPRRMRLWSNDASPPVQKGMRLVRTIDTQPDQEDETDADESVEGESAQGRYWHWYIRPKSSDDDLSRTSEREIPCDHHTDDVIARAQAMLGGLPLPADVKEAVILAARFHDHGKRRRVWQRSIGNFDTNKCLAKSVRRIKFLEQTHYRHEFGSLVDVSVDPEFQRLSENVKDLVLHLIAVHHGFGRPHFPAENAFDTEPKGVDVDAIAAEVPRRFARLQKKYGRWGLAYLESLLRAADYAASAEPSPSREEQK